MRRKLKAKSRGDEQKPDMRRDALGASGHVTTKPSICNFGGNAGAGAFCKSGAYARQDSCLATGDLSGAAREVDARLGVGQPALNTVEKSAEGVAGRGEGSNPQSRLKARTVPYLGLEGAGLGLVLRSGALHPTRMKLMINGNRLLPRLSRCALCAWRRVRHAGRRATGAEHRGEVSRGHSRPGAPGRRPERCECWARA